MDINEVLSFLGENRPILTVFVILMWWLERSGRLSSEKRERELLRELADCPPEPEGESIIEKIGAVPTVLIMAFAASVLIGCTNTATPIVSTQIGATSWPTEAQFATPTQIATPAIKEATPAPEWIWETIGTYTPLVVSMNIRECSKVDDELCPIVGEVPINEAVQFYALVRHNESGDVWLCLDPEPSGDELLSQCGEMVAYSLAGKEYGKLTFAEPQG